MRFIKSNLTKGGSHIMRSNFISQKKVLQITQKYFMNILKCFDDHQMQPKY